MDKLSETDKAENIEVVTKSKFSKNLLYLIIGIVCVVFLIGAVVFSIPKLNSPTFYPDLLLDYAELWPIEFSDPFEAESLSHWKLSDGSIDAGITRMTTSEGQFEIAVAPTKDHIVRDAFFNDQAVASGNFLLTMKITPPISCHTGLVFRGTDLGEYYLFLVGNDTYTAEILRRNNDGDLPREAIIENTAFPEGVGQPYTLNVLALNDSYYFYIDRIFVG